MKTSKSRLSHHRQLRLFLGTLIALVVADGLITKFLVSERFAREGNPFLQDLVGEDTFLGIKLAGVFVSALILWDMYKHHPRASYITTLCFVVIYTVIVFWNLLIFFVA